MTAGNYKGKSSYRVIRVYSATSFVDYDILCGHDAVHRIVWDEFLHLTHEIDFHVRRWLQERCIQQLKFQMQGFWARRVFIGRNSTTWQSKPPMNTIVEFLKLTGRSVEDKGGQSVRSQVDKAHITLASVSNYN
jgi:hypothetical protein